MKFRSTNGKAPIVSARDAVRSGLAPDGGLYMPERIPTFSPSFIEESRSLSFAEIGEAIAAPFFKDDLTADEIRTIVADTCSFPVPLVEVEQGTHSLELFHGPTLAFKDFGARFLARISQRFQSSSTSELTVLVATSGDTGGAVAQGFLGLEGIRVVLLYPAGGVSLLQEKQLTTLGQNITALEVEGSFDDCQQLVKEAFSDHELARRYGLTSANSINVGRLIPQCFYYFFAWSQLPRSVASFDVAVPCGNFGNLTAAVICKRMGLPIGRMIAATNRNDVIPRYLMSGVFEPRPSVRTISNAMDVGNPSNFARLLDLYGGEIARIRSEIQGFSFDDERTAAVIGKVFDNTGYLMDPHGAVAYLGLQSVERSNGPAIFLETAHPAKFKETVEEAIGTSIPLPQSLRILLDREKHTIKIRPELKRLHEVLEAGAGK